MTAAEPKTRADLGWATLSLGWSSRAHTDRGAARIGDRASSFSLSREQALVQMTQIEEARGLRVSGAELVFGGVTDVRVALARADKGGTLAPEELIAIGRAAQACHLLGKSIAAHAEQAPRLAEVAAAITDTGHVYFPILESFDDDGRLTDSASESLGRLRKKVGRLISELDDSARTLLDDSRLHPHLQDRFYTQRDDRYVIPIKVESRGHIPGIVHGTSQSGQTVFIEPQALVELNNKLKLAECEVADEERRIYAELSGYVKEETPALRAGLEAATELDVIDAGALLADALEAHVAVVPEYGERIELGQASHPLMILSGKGCIPNDIALELGTGLVISGPNAGGKTVALKTVGLAALMVRAGLPIASAKGSIVPWFDDVASDIGDSQSLEMDLSTFSAKLLRLGEFLNRAGSGALMLIDEIAVGTEPEQGASLAQSVLESLVEAGATVIATTHYERLKMLAGSDSRFSNASVGFDLERLEPTFRLTLGTPGASGALRIAKRLGLPRTVTGRAQEILGDARASVDELIDSLEIARGELEAERAEVAQMREQIADAKRAATRAESRAKELEKRARAGAHSDATVALKDARRELESARVLVRKKSSSADLKAVEKNVDAAARAIGANAPAKPTVGRAAKPDELKVGTPVYVVNLGARGEVLEAPRSGRVAVSVGSLRTLVKLKDLRIEPGRTAPKSKPPRGAAPKSAAPAKSSAADVVRTPDATLDLRGQRADEAVNELDRFVDRSLLTERSVLFVIHGHGTGALRTAVRGHLASHPSVVEWRPGDLREGGDGVTVALLDA